MKNFNVIVYVVVFSLYAIWSAGEIFLLRKEMNQQYIYRDYTMLMHKCVFHEEKWACDRVIYITKNYDLDYSKLFEIDWNNIKQD